MLGQYSRVLIMYRQDTESPVNRTYVAALGNTGWVVRRKLVSRLLDQTFSYPIATCCVRIDARYCEGEAQDRGLVQEGLFAGAYLPDDQETQIAVGQDLVYAVL